jgi:hypothetical protein
MNKVSVLLIMALMSFSVFAVGQPTENAPGVYEYNLIDAGAFINDCGGNRTQVSPQPPCIPDGKAYLIDDAIGVMTYNWTQNGEIKVDGEVCNIEKNLCKNIRDTFWVVKSFPDKGSVVLNERGELLEVIFSFNKGNNVFTFGSEKIGYIVKAKGDAPGWVYK